MQAIDHLIAFLEENNSLDLIDQIDLDQLLQIFDQSDDLTHKSLASGKNKKKSNKFPASSLNHNVLAFVKPTCNDIEINIKIQQDNDNLSSADKQALSALSQNSTITIKPSDKGGGGNIVIMDNEKYIEQQTVVLRYLHHQDRKISTRVL